MLSNYIFIYLNYDIVAYNELQFILINHSIDYTSTKMKLSYICIIALALCSGQESI